jgi:diguanylate cyclase (GGDEF)-like protein
MVEETTLSTVLIEFADTLVTDFPVKCILDHLVKRVIEVLPVTSAGVTLIASDQKPHYVAASDGTALRYESLQSELGEGPCLAAYRTGEAVAVADLANDGRFRRFRPAALAAGLGAVFTFPLHREDSRLGAMDLYRETPGPLSAQDMATAQTLANVAATYITTVQSRADAHAAADYFRQSASHDELTGLPNRALLAQRLEHACQRGRRSHAQMAVLFADLDRFKSVNDTHGHLVGDQVLQAVAKRLTAVLRPGDTLARVCGDEFVILCEDMQDAGYVEVLAARIGKAFTPPFVIGSREITLTASVGIAFAGSGEDMPQQLMHDADTAMYRAKRKGGAGHHILDLRDSVGKERLTTGDTDV